MLNANLIQHLIILCRSDGADKYLCWKSLVARESSSLVSSWQQPAGMVVMMKKRAKFCSDFLFIDFWWFPTSLLYFTQWELWALKMNISCETFNKSHSTVKLGIHRGRTRDGLVNYAFLRLPHSLSWNLLLHLIWQTLDCATLSFGFSKSGWSRM